MDMIKLLRNTTFIFSLLPVVTFAEQTIAPDTQLRSLKSGLNCASSDNSKPCAYINEFIKAKKPEEMAEYGKRFIDIGYVIDDKNRQVDEHLVLIEYRFTGDFHRKIYFPNMLCATFVTPTQPGEKEIIEDALRQLKQNRIPSDNLAYKWAKGYKWKKSHLCHKLGKDDNSITSHSGNWLLRKHKNAYLFYAKDWTKENTHLVFRHTLP